jgi:methionine aminotransferase
MLAFLNPGDEIIFFEPFYDAYIADVAIAGARARVVRLHAPDWHFDVDELAAAFNERTKLQLLNTPHNPTGTTWSADDMRQLQSIVDGTNIILIGDEVYEHIIFDGRRHEILLRYPDLRSRSVVISSFGKTFHTTGWKVGYCVGPQPLIAEVIRVHQFMTFTVHTPSQIAFAEFVKRDPAASELAPFYQNKRDLFLQLTSGSRFRPLPCGGTYFQLFDYSAISSEKDKDIAHRLIVEHGVASIPVSAFLYKDPGGPVLRFCFAKKDDTLRAAAERLVKI